MTSAKTLTVAKFNKAIDGSAGIITTIAKRMQVSRYRLSVWLNSDKCPQEVKNSLKQEKEKLLDLAESKLIKKINEEDYASLKWFLATQGKSRGYSEKQIIEHEGKFEPIQVVLAVHEKKD